MEHEWMAKHFWAVWMWLIIYGPHNEDFLSIENPIKGT